MRFNLIFSSYLCLLGDLCLASLSTKLGKTINFTNNIMTRKKTTPMGGAVMDQNPHQLRKKITFGPNTVQLIILFVTSNHQTTSLVLTNFFHSFSSWKIKWTLHSSSLFLVLDQCKGCFLFQLHKLRKIHRRKTRLVVWWFYVTNKNDIRL